jgi:ribosomal subunit interface protein
MATEAFTFEFLNRAEALGAELDQRMRTLAEERLQKLQKGHNDLIGAAVSLEQPANATTNFIYEARVVAYARPENVAATATENDPMGALKNALAGVERQIRERRDKLRDRSR